MTKNSIKDNSYQCKAMLWVDKKNSTTLYRANIITYELHTGRTNG